MRRRAHLEIHRDDHKLDVLGKVFLGVVQGDDVLFVLRRYLGPTASLRRVELEDDRLSVEADLTEFPEESANLLELSRAQARAGRERAARGHLEEALRLSPLAPEILKALGRFHYRRREREPARRYLVRAREAAPGDLDILRLLAEIAIHDDRRLDARAYLQRLLRARPGDRRARSALGRLRPGTEQFAGSADSGAANAEPASPTGDVASPPDADLR